MLNQIGLRPSLYRFACSLIALCALDALCGPQCQAKEPWQERVFKAHSLELGRDYRQAAAQYQQALALLPAHQDNERAKLEAALGICFFKTEQYDKGLDCGERLIEIIRRLQASKTLDPDVLLSAQSYKDASGVQINPKMPYSSVHTLLQRYGGVSLALRQVLNPGDPLLSDRVAYARSYVALFKDKEAEKTLLDLLPKIKAGTPLHWQVRADVAALRAKKGDMTLTQQLEEKLRKQKPEPQVLLDIAEGQFWAADYGRTEKTLDLALTKLANSKGDKVMQEVAIQSLYASTEFDHTGWKVGEPHLRRAIAVLEGDVSNKDVPTHKKALRQARKALAFCLRAQNRGKEAEAINTFDGAADAEGTTDPSAKMGANDPRTKQYEFMLTDDERHALLKAGSKAKSAPAK